MINDILPTGNGFSDKVYNVLKWVTLILLPAFATFYFALSGVWGWPNAEEVMATCTAVATFLGVLIGVSNKNYENSDARFDGVLVTEQTENGVMHSLEYTGGDIDQIQNKDAVTFKVVDQNEPFWTDQP